MHLKSIDIVGYKSFADKTHVDLEPGITGVIGPNGCGKSNVMESVRWCLGEMSWKSLRAGSMTDVIFSGTTKRSPQSLSEVTLTFDNASSLLPVEYSEVTVTRRLFRSGESQYFLNKTQCRLRDVREMFLDTGLGGDGYAIIDQGGVDSMIRSKPEERRAFFEEAAGVAKYNAKREEALRKLDRVDMDLGRLQDSVALIEEQVKKLDSDARRAKLYAKYKEELTAMEAAHIIEQSASIEAELALMQERIGPVEQILGERRSQIGAEGANHAALNLEKTGEQNRLIEANQKVAEVKTSIGRLEERLQSSAASVASMEARVEACRVEADADRARAASIDPEIASVAASIAAAEASLAEAKNKAEMAAEELKAIEARVSEAQSAKDALAREAQAKQQEAYELGRGLSGAESEFSRAEVRARAALKSLERDQTSAAEAAGRLAEAKAEAVLAETAFEAAKTAAEAAETRSEELRSAASRLSEETVTLHSALAQTKARAESLESQGGQNPYWVGAQAVLGANIPGVVGMVRGLFRADESIKPELEDLLGERLFAVVVEDSTAARSGVELLQASGAGRARFLVLSSLPEYSDKQYPAEAKPVLSRLTYDPRHEKALRHLFAEAYELGGKLFGDHWVFGGAAAKDGPQPTLADLGEIKEKLGTLELRGTSLAEERAANEAALTEALQAARLMAQALSQESGRRHGLEARVNQLEQSLANHSRNVELSTDEAARALADASLAKESIRERRENKAAAEARVAEARVAETAAAEALAAAREELSGKRAAFQGQDERRRGAEQELSAYTSSRKRLDDEKATLEAAIARLASEAGELAARKAESLEAQERMRAEIAALGESLAASENEAKGVFDRLQDLQNKIDSMGERIKVLQAEHDQAQADLHQHEVHASALKSKSDLLKTRLWDEWQMTAEEARNKYKDVVADVEKIETLRKRIANMGNINMAAPEEYSALAEKQRFLIDQINDLLKAKDDLKAAIVKINNATRENFRQTFTEVREHFRRLYGVLFEGGEADLILTDPENILETGVDILAQPPGKKLQSIMLLSGGEKTLTAIALLFAFFMVKPSPFCMLDEADAALDDANIERFVSLLREFQNKTQFLIVSHNKRTMEAADVIYGVTMEEKGVSQLVSVDFRKKVGGTEREATKSKVVQQGPFAEPSSEA
ncbi:MAG: chromosome segregation protein SMC [Elusimicrobiota bacterium]|nr:MAG: chromosome segregation protein SMC [Elusimicrobiota bacterium]